MQLLTPREQKEKYYFHHVVEGLMRGDSKSRAEYYKIMWGWGFFTENEIRELEDKDPNPNPLADELFVPAGMVPLSKYEEFLAKNTGQQGPPPDEIKEEATEGEEAARSLQLIKNRRDGG